MTDERPTIREFFRRHPAVMAYVLIALMWVGFYWRVEALVANQAEQARKDSIAVCQSNADVRQAILDVVDLAARPAAHAAGETPERFTQIEKINADRREMRASIAELLLPPPCALELDTPITVTPRTGTTAGGSTIPR